MEAADAVHGDVLDLGTVHGRKRNGRAVGIENGHVADGEILETALRDRSELDAVRAGSTHAVLQEDVLAHVVGGMGLEAEDIVGRIDVAVPDDHVLAVHDVDAVVVPVRFAIDPNPLYINVVALVIGLVPAARILQEDILDGHAVALPEVDVLGTVHLVGPVQLEGILKEAAMDVFHHVVGHGEAPSVDGTAARNADIFLLEGEDHAGPPHVQVLDIVPGIERTQQGGALFKVQRYIVFDVDGARHPVAGGEHHAAATVCAGKIDGCLNALGIERDPICPGAEIGHEIVFRSESRHKDGEHHKREEKSFHIDSI